MLMLIGNVLLLPMESAIKRIAVLCARGVRIGPTEMTHLIAMN